MDRVPLTPKNGVARKEAVVRKGPARFTVLTERLLRMEYDPEEKFEDRPSQVVLCRDFPVPEFSVEDNGKRLEIATKNYIFVYEYGASPLFTPETVHAETINSFTNYGGFWRYKETAYGDLPRSHNLMGCARTLDRTDGPAKLDMGFLDQSGRTFYDDSAAPVWEGDSLTARRPGTEDVYFIACQHDYVDTLKELFQLTGRPPMLPRWALGNWWSRYWKYSEESYTALMDSYAEREIPFTVGILDMDWHVTKVDRSVGNGWTGYTWNRDLFPDPARFLASMQKKGLHIGMNLHPASGIQCFEEAYESAARRMGVDPETKKPVVFDFTDPAFRATYFEELLHPHEAIGVNFWWIDWQQGRKSAVEGLDPLWLLNHYHYEDSCRNGRRGLILSRYAGPGAQRTPAGFSGDAVSTWKSLAFQPYFTATSVNALFPWWSHDIGGFSGGTHNAELYLRWVEFGVFSPFMRLHCNNNAFMNKDPAAFDRETAQDAAKFLRLRHRLIPYLYSEVQKQHRDLIPFLQPVYYHFPAMPSLWTATYEYMNAYFFGENLFVAPIVSPADEETKRGFLDTWLPEGLWTDVFTGKTLTGGRRFTFCRKKDEIPVLARAGAIVPLSGDKGNSCANPAVLDVYVFPGAKGDYELIEDDGETDAFDRGESFSTHFSFDPEKGTFSVRGEGNKDLVPEKRTYRLHFRGFEPFEVTGEGVESRSYDAGTRTLTVLLSPRSPAENVTLTLSGARREEGRDLEERVFRLLNDADILTTQKVKFLAAVTKNDTREKILQEWIGLHPSDALLSCLSEEIAR